VLVLLLCINAYRAWRQSIVHDEAFTYHLYLAGPPSTIFQYYTSNLHFLFVILAKLSVTLFGVSTFAMRLPTVVAGALYFAAERIG
jgi:4-amino-4-deoxy-L-arabinose transferase-like glycosyltransferase